MGVYRSRYSNIEVTTKLTQLADTICLGCACACDDIDLSVRDNRVVDAPRACELGREWLTAEPPAADVAATIDHRPITLDEAIEAAAQILAAARAPLVYGLRDTTCDAQRRAVAIADWAGGTIDVAGAAAEGPTGVAFHGVGDVTCTLGEVRHRADLVIFWGADPHVTHPRHAERFSLDAPGMFLPGGRADRTCVVVDSHRTATAADADIFLPIRADAHFEALWTLRAILQGIELDAAAIKTETGIPLTAWHDLAERMRRARFGVLMHGGGLTASRGGSLNVEAALALTRDMNAFTRFVCLPLRSGRNSAGAENVLLWSAGYPFGVDFAAGYPRYHAHEYTADSRLARCEVDAALIVADGPLDELSPAAHQQLVALPTIWVGPVGVAPQPLKSAQLALSDVKSRTSPAHVAIQTAKPGIGCGGTIYRTDGVPLSLRPAAESSLPSDAEVLARIELRLKQLRGYGRVPPRPDKPRRV